MMTEPQPQDEGGKETRVLTTATTGAPERGVRRFKNVYACLEELRRSQNPAHQREAQLAMDILWGRRPGIEEKYDALLLKLDRSFSNLIDKRDYWKQVAEESPLVRTRQFAKAKVTALNVLMTDLLWMRARNSDLIAAVAGDATYKKTPRNENE